MGAYDDEAPRLSEIVRMLHGMDRKFDEFRHQFQNQLNEKVSKEYYGSETARITDKLVTIENRYRMLSTAVWGGVVSLVVGGILVFVQNR